MDGNCLPDEGTEELEEDIIQLLNAKTQKNRQILSITSAAADAVTSLAQTRTKQASFEPYLNQNYAENKENHDSFVSSASMDRSFSGQHRVRIPSRLLREIKSPMDRSSSGNVSSSDSKGTMSESFFGSQSSSEHSSIQAIGPVPTVIKYSSQPSQKSDPFVVDGNKSRLNDTPVVIKYLQEYTSPSSKESSVNNSESEQTQAERNLKDSKTEDGNKTIGVPATTSQKSPEKSVEIHSKIKPEIVVSGGKNTSTERSKGSLVSKQTEREVVGQLATEPVKIKRAGLCQGAPSNNISYVAESQKGEVKAVSFSASDKGKATRDMLGKRQEHCPAVRRVVQPKIIQEKAVSENQGVVRSEEKENRDLGVAAQDKTSSNNTAVQFSSGFEDQMKNLMNALGAIENQCHENRAWQEKQQQELEQGIKQRDERRLQHLEEMQKQLVEYQLRYAQPANIPPHHTCTSTAGATTQGMSTTTQVYPVMPLQQALPQSNLQASSVEVPRQHVSHSVATSNPHYTAAIEHKTQPSFKTTVYGKPRDENPKSSGVKRKLVRNSRTQTSPQVSSSVSSSDTSSPLDTPLPRKRHPVPMARDWKADRGKKHVHFDTPEDIKAEDSLKKRAYAYPAVRSHENEDQKTNGLRNLPKAYHERQRPLPVTRSPESDHIVNDISRLRQELRDALNETEQTKQSLKNLDDRIHSQISSDESVSVTLPDHTRPYPLDAYLRATRDVPEELSTPKVEGDVQTKPKRETAVQEQGLCAHAHSVLRDVQKQRENLEWNLMALSRRHDEQYLYNLVEDDGTNGDALRIRNDVAKRIEEIDAAVQAELLLEEQQRALENQVSQDKSKIPKQGPRSTRGVPVSTEKRAKLRNVGKENAPSRGRTAAKPKISKPTAKQPAVKRPFEDVTYASRVHGRPDHVTGRTTTQTDRARYKSSEAVKLRRSAAPMKHKIRSPPRLDESSSSTLSEDYRPPTSRAAKPRYYFQPNAGADQSVIEAHFRENQGPLPGQLLPIAIPLGKPRMDPALRLPLCTNEEVSRLPQTVTVSTNVKRPNVAVITLKDDEFLQTPDSGVKRQKESIPKKRERLTLEKQILPNVDIDTSGVSEISSNASSKEVSQPTILPIPHPLPRPDASEYEEFKDYEHVGTIDDDQGSEKSSVPGGGSLISLHGKNRTDKPKYQGPAFPPRNVPVDVLDHDGFQGTSDDLRAPSETVENKARELIEQELLARVVSDMTPPLSDPTARMRRSESSQSLADSSDTEPAAAIGLRGLQLFVDAGIPVDTELVRNLIMEVLQEKVASMLGYPKPQEHVPAADTQEPDDDYTEPESGSEDYSRVQTPVRTPSVASQPESHPVTHVSTPEQTQSPESMSSSTPDEAIGKNDVTSGHMVMNKLSDEIEEGLLEDSVHKSPIATPVVTPSPPQSVASLVTPDESEREKAVSEEKSPVETPEITVSIRDKTSEESPKELDEEDLKEQTLMEDDEEDQKTDADIPAIKFELEPEPSETKITNSPSSATTTTYSTQSTMGTVATDDEISEGEQLQPYVHVGQYSEGEFVAPSGTAGNMTTLHEIPDDVFDTFNASNKRKDPVKQAVHDLLKLDDVSDESTSRGSEYSHSISEGQHRMGFFAENIVQNEQSEGEVVGDVVSTLLNRIRQSVQRTRPRVVGDTASVGELEEASPPHSFSQRFPRQVRGEDEMSPGEFNSSDQGVATNIEPIPMRALDRPSVLDSDENNNASEQSSSISEIQNQTWDTNIIMVTPKKATVPHSPPADREVPTTAFPRVVHVEEARHVSTPTGFFSSPEPGSESKDQITMETLSEIDIGSRTDPVIDHVADVSNDVTPKQMLDERARIQLTLPSVEPSASVSLISEGILRSDDSAEDISSISGGEI